MSIFDPKAVRLVASAPTPGILFGIALDEPRRTLYGAGMDGAVYSLLYRTKAFAAKKLASTRTTSPRWRFAATRSSPRATTQADLVQAGEARSFAR